MFDGWPWQLLALFGLAQAYSLHRDRDLVMVEAEVSRVEQVCSLHRFDGTIRFSEYMPCDEAERRKAREPQWRGSFVSHYDRLTYVFTSPADQLRHEGEAIESATHQSPGRKIEILASTKQPATSRMR